MKDWQLKMWFDFDEEECGFETYSAEIGGKQEGWYLPPAFRSRFFQRERFVEFFLFDGETARELTSEQDSNQVEDAILELTGLIHVKDIAKVVHWIRIEQQSSRPHQSTIHQMPHRSTWLQKRRSMNTFESKNL